MKVFLLFFALTIIGSVTFTSTQKTEDDIFLSYIVDPETQDIQLYWKNDNGEPLKSIQNLKTFVESKQRTLVFAMNAGMYTKDNSPKGLFIQYHQMLSPLDTSSGNGNFYLKPNGVFYITTLNVPVISTTPSFKDNGHIKFATQSGPMLVIDNKIHPAFTKGSPNANIRNGVGILPGNRIVFVMSTQEVNFYDFANYLKKIGCKNALYLDGLVSRTYLPEKNWLQTDGNFGVIIGVTKTHRKI